MTSPRSNQGGSLRVAGPAPYRASAAASGAACRHARELHAAREVQRALQPGSVPPMRGIELGMVHAPAHELGGDFIEILPGAGGRLGWVVGDAAGHGVPAALLAAMAVGLLRGYRFRGRRGPGRILKDLNGRLRSGGATPRLVAMMMAVYDERARRLTISNGGLPWPYLVRGGVATKIAVAGLPLGVLDGFDYDEIHVALRPGDVVAFCSDGFTECMDREKTMFGDARIRSVLGAHASRGAREIGHALLEAVTAHAGGPSRRGDDCAAVVVKATAACPRPRARSSSPS